METSADLKPEEHTEVAQHMTQEDNAKPSAAKPEASRGGGAKRGSASKKRKGAEAEDEAETPEKKARRERLEKGSKCIQLLKVTYDKIHRDLSAVGIIEARLKQKKWCSEGPLNFLKEETAKVRAALDEMFEKWVAAKSTDLNNMSDTEIDIWVQEQEKIMHAMTDQFKTYSRETLSEFSKMK